MSETAITPDVALVPPPQWPNDYCHVYSVGESNTFCGAKLGGKDCLGFYEGEAICPSCGCPTCPSCAILSDAEDRIEEELS